MADAIEARDLDLAYRLDLNRAGSLKQFMLNLFLGQLRRETLWALREVSFSIGPGEVFGVIGPNGAGKSTLMKIIAQVLPPTNGRVIVRGSVAAMISLGAGFNTDMTAHENIVLYGTLLGNDISFMRSRVDAILDWSELQEFRDVPLRNFSSGMLARLAFSVATDSSADILVVDEVLSVGDESFRIKSLERMEELIRSGSTVVFVSHNLNTVKKLCDRVMWLHRGAVQMIGDPSEVVDAYKASVADSQ